jgi:subfamily B ATP-binding cassette protein MsbA
MKNKYTAFRVLLRIFLEYILPLRLHFIGALLSTFIVARCSALVIRKIEPSVNSIFDTSSFETIVLLCIGLFGISLTRGVFECLQNFCVKYIGHRILCNFQIQLFDSLIKSDTKYIQNQPVGHILSRFTNDILRMKALFIAFFSGCFRHIFLFCFLVVETIRMDLYLAIVLLALIFLVGYLVNLIGQKLRNIEYVLQQTLAEYTSRLNQAFSSIKTIKAFSASEYEIKNTNSVVENIMKLYKNQIAYDSLTYLFVECASGIAITSILLYWGSICASQGYLGGPGRLTAFIMAFISLYRPFKGMMSLNFALNSGLAATIRVFKVIDERSESLANKPKGIEILHPQAICFTNISLKFQQSEILQNCELNVELGEIVVIVGPSGSGKSSIINLITGFINPDKGKIEIKSDAILHNLNSVSETNIAKHISLVTQDPCLFYATIAENISYGGLFDMQSVIQISKKLGIHDFICALPNQYYTIVGHSGLELSGLEKQQICIARALLKNGPIMLFDETLTYLDSQSRQRFFNTLEEIKKDKIIVITSANVPQYKSISRILFLEKGNLKDKTFL